MATTPEIRKWAGDQLASGYTKTHISVMLKSQGWKPEEVQEILAAAEAAKPKPVPPAPTATPKAGVSAPKAATPQAVVPTAKAGGMPAAKPAATPLTAAPKPAIPLKVGEKPEAAAKKLAKPLIPNLSHFALPIIAAVVVALLLLGAAYVFFGLGM